MITNVFVNQKIFIFIRTYTFLLMFLFMLCIFIYDFCLTLIIVLLHVCVTSVIGVDSHTQEWSVGSSSSQH